MSRVLAVINFIDRHGRPVDPGFGNEEGGRPDNSLPDGDGITDPGYGHPIFVRPGHGLPLPPRTWPPSFPPKPTDPEWGVGGSGGGTLPIFLPARPDNSLPGLPPVAGHLPVENPPPGTIWPPLPPGAAPGRAALLFWLEGVGYRYVVVDLTTTPDNELPSGKPSRPDNTLPTAPEPK